MTSGPPDALWVSGGPSLTRTFESRLQPGFAPFLGARGLLKIYLIYVDPTKGFPQAIVDTDVARH